MPTYVYKCAECGHMFEVRQRMSDDPLTDCPNCKRSAVRRVINNVGIVFKGNGFYVTDNRNGKNGAAPSNGTGSTSKDSESKSKTDAGAKAVDSAAGKSEKATTAADSA